MLYHRNIKWSEDFDKQINLFLDSTNNFIYSKHLVNQKDYKHNINLKRLRWIIDKIKNNHYKAFECEIDNNKVIKFVIRTSYIYNKNHISIVFLPKENGILIKTAWLNDKDDKHYTLRRDKYESNIYCR